jgi:hypothetical protein
MKKFKITIDNETVEKINRSKRREARKEAGLNDGRFNTQVVKNKKKYSRKNKHKNVW